MLGIVVPSAHGFHAIEPAHGDGVDGGLGAAGEHDVGVAHDEGAPCLADGVAGCGAGGAGGDVGAAQSVVEREHPRRHVEDHHRDEEWGDPAGAAVEQCLVLFLHRAKPADAGADEGADAVAVGRGQIQPGVVDRLPAGHHGELGEPVGAPNLLGRGEGRGGVEVLHFAGDGAGVALGVVCGDRADAALAGEEIFPEGADPLAKRCDDAEAGDDDSLSCWIRHETKQGSQAKLPGLSRNKFQPLGLGVFDKLDDIPDALELFGILVGNLGFEFLLQCHDQLDGVERVRAQVLDELGLRLDLVLVDAELLDDDFTDSICEWIIRHKFPNVRGLL